MAMLDSNEDSLEYGRAHAGVDEYSHLPSSPLRQNGEISQYSIVVADIY